MKYFLLWLSFPVFRFFINTVKNMNDYDVSLFFYGCGPSPLKLILSGFTSLYANPHLHALLWIELIFHTEFFEKKTFLLSYHWAIIL